MWYTFALLSALFASVRRANEKQLSLKINHFTIGWAIQLLALPSIFIALLTFGKLLNPFSLGLKFWVPTVLVWIGFYPLNTYFYINALKHGELSKILPLQGLGPVFALLLAWLLINQRPSIMAVVGIVFIVIGIYILNLKGKYLHNPLHIFTKDKANFYTLICILLYTLAGILDTIAMRASEPIFYCFVSTAGAAATLYLTSLLFKSKDTVKVKQNFLPLLAGGSLFGLSYLFYLIAISSGPVAYATALRSTNSVIGAIIGITYFKESFTKIQALSLVIIVLGSGILVLSR